MSSWRWLALLAMLVLPACYATTSAYVEADAPVGVEAYPQAYYDGRVVYWVGDRWYARDRGVWFYYRTEPAYLYEHRARWGPRYAPAPRRYYAPAPRRYYRPYYGRPHYRRAAPPARRAAPPARHAAPPVRHAAPPRRP